MKPSDVANRINLGADPIGHPSVQPWSAGHWFPAVIYRQDAHDTVPAPDGSYPLRYSQWCVILDGKVRCGYASHDDAELVARILVDPAYKAERERWSA